MVTGVTYRYIDTNYYIMYFPAEMLLSSDKMELAAEAMHELGNLHFHITDVRFGFKLLTRN